MNFASSESNYTGFECHFGQLIQCTVDTTIISLSQLMWIHLADTQNGI